MRAREAGRVLLRDRRRRLGREGDRSQNCFFWPGDFSNWAPKRRMGLEAHGGSAENKGTQDTPDAPQDYRHDSGLPD